jgi:hypothetical protein
MEGVSQFSSPRTRRSACVKHESASTDYFVVVADLMKGQANFGSGASTCTAYIIAKKQVAISRNPRAPAQLPECIEQWGLGSPGD